ncbi:MAG: DUF748 domain-containing protein, partial [Myxococcota bacterium]|nr:DUF748 domain-containing protein [Myxococcota bacterium]
IRLRDLDVIERETRESVLDVPQFDVEGISLQYPEQKAHIDRVVSRGARYDARRLSAGDFRGQRLALPPDHRDSPATNANPEEPAPEIENGEDNAAWTFDIGLIEFTNYQLAYEDRTTPTPFVLAINPIDLRIEGLDSDFTQPFEMALSLGIGDGGLVKAEGPVRLEPPEVDLELAMSEIDLTPLAPYWQEQLALDLASGRLGLTGRLQARPESEDDPQFTFDGDLRVDGFRALDDPLASELFSFESLELDGIALAYEPTSFHLARFGLNQPTARLVLDHQGVPNLASVIRESPDEEALAETATEEQATPEADDDANPESGAIPASIGLVEITNGLAEFQDRSVSPYFSTSISELSGRIEGLTSAVDSQGQVALSGRLGGATALKIDGSMNALSEKTALDLQVAFENFELAPFTPYSGRYVGKAIERGKLFVDLQYRLDGNVLKGENSIFLDQFTLGNDIESPDAIKLPIGLAVALLKDRKGEIRIDLPVRGEIDDPEFSVGGIIFSALLNLITKVAMSPFSIMGGLVSADADDLRYIEFDPGATSLSAEQDEKLTALANALVERPVLSLEIKGGALSGIDGRALQEAQFESDLRQEHFRELQSRWFGNKPDSVEEVVVEPEDRSRLIRDAFLKTFGKEALKQLEATQSTRGLAADPEAPEVTKERAMAERLRDQIEIPPGQLRDLARERAAQIQDHVIRAGGIPPERVFVLDVEVQKDAPDPRPRTTLSLAAY